MDYIAKGAVAAAEAQQLETTARGQAAAAQIIAKGEADAEVTRADGARNAARLLEEHDVAVELAKIGATGEALSKSGSSLILGDNPSAVGSMLLGGCPASNSYSRVLFPCRTNCSDLSCCSQPTRIF